MLTNSPVLFDFCIGNLISHLFTVGSMPVYHSVLNSVLNVKALIGAFNQETALVGASSAIVKTDGSFAALQ